MKIDDILIMAMIVVVSGMMVYALILMISELIKIYKELNNRNNW